MAQFKSLLIAAAVTSLLAGLLLTLVQQAQVIPLIEQAEVLESQQTHSHAAHEQEHAAMDEHAHEHVWMPQQGMQRQLFTTLSNVVIALGFTLILAAGVLLAKRQMNWQRGLLWGLAGYAVFFLAPAIGMTPELPGMTSADLGQRQLWWICASSCSAVGLALIVFMRVWMYKLSGVVVLLLPHIIGAPSHDGDPGVPLAMLQAFLLASVIANGLFWLSMGGLYGYFHNKWVKQ